MIIQPYIKTMIDTYPIFHKKLFFLFILLLIWIGIRIVFLVVLKIMLYKFQYPINKQNNAHSNNSLKPKAIAA